MAQLTVPRQFFEGELKVYTDWRQAFIREILQNSIDAHPSRIAVTFNDTEDGAQVIVDDDGTGMSQDTLENVFFALGRTTKVGDGTIGGFGRARIIICFAQRSYTIETRNLHVIGSGGEYDITLAPERRRGSVFTINTIDQDCSRLRDALEQVLYQSSLTIPVFVNGELTKTEPPPGRAARILRDDAGAAWSKVYVTPGIGSLTVRVRGLSMYRTWIVGNEDVIVELAPQRSRHVLTAARDNLRGVYRSQVDEFVADLAQNRRRALKADPAPLRLAVAGGGFTMTSPKPAPVEGCDAETTERHREPAAAYTTRQAQPKGSAEPVHFEPVESRPGAEPLDFDVFLLAEERSARTRKLARDWNPERWAPGRNNRRRKLLTAWRAAVLAAVSALLDELPTVGTLSWTVGFTFDPDARACHQPAGDGRHIFAINPVGEGLTMTLSAARADDRRALVAAALHEVCHVAEQDHNENFAALLTALYARLDQRIVMRQIGDALRA